MENFLRVRLLLAMHEICEKAGIEKISNHSLRATPSHCVISEQYSFIPNPKNNWTSIREGTPEKHSKFVVYETLCSLQCL